MPGTVSIKRATVSDIGACLPLLSDLHKGDIGGTMSDCFAEFCTAPNAVALIARREGEIVGLVTGTEAADLDFESHAAVINAIIVARTCRGIGIGRSLMDAFVEWAHQRCCAAVLYSTGRDYAKRFARAVGFVPRSPASTFIKHLVSPNEPGISRRSEKE